METNMNKQEILNKERQDLIDELVRDEMSTTAAEKTAAVAHGLWATVCAIEVLFHAVVRMIVPASVVIAIPATILAILTVGRAVSMDWLPYYWPVAGVLMFYVMLTEDSGLFLRCDSVPSKNESMVRARITREIKRAEFDASCATEVKEESFIGRTHISSRDHGL